MKIKYIILSAFLFTIISCNKDVLDQTNPNTLTVEEFWETQDDAQRGINSAYAMFFQNGGWSRWIYFRLDLTSDEGFSNSPWVELADWTRFQYVNYNFWEGNNWSWRDTYKTIFRCNQVLENVPGIQFTDESLKPKILAQAKFLRAFYYYYGAILWENMPLVLETPKDPGVQHQHNTLAEVWTQVEKDLREAAADLPEEWDAPNVGRATKGSAYGMLARCLMQQKKWDEAKTVLDYFITGGGSSLYDLVAYQDNFRANNENNKESVFEIQFSNANTGGDADVVNNNMGNNRPQFFAPRGIGWSDGQARYWLVEEFKKEKTADGKIDPRLQHSLFYKESFEDFGVKTYGKNWEWGDKEAWFKKYSRDYYRSNEDYYSEVNNRVIRYADILLMYAEVLNELGQTSNAYQYVNRVRARAGMSPLATAYPSIGTNKDAFRERLKTERALELSGESVRWADLKRWGDLDTQAGVDKVKQRDPDFNNFVVNKHIRLPIPQIEVLNNPNLEQNPNY